MLHYNFHTNSPLVTIMSQVKGSTPPHPALVRYIWILSHFNTDYDLALLFRPCHSSMLPSVATQLIMLEFYVLLTVHPYTISQINPTRDTILFNIFIYFSSLHVSGVHAPIIERNCCIYATLAVVTLCGWLLVCWLDWNPTSRPNATHTEWQVPVSHRYSNFLLMMGAWTPETCILNRILHIVGFICEIMAA
jgi:hypothetical protein